MTGPVARVTCPKCGRLFARRQDGTPYVHSCDLAKEFSVPDHPRPVPDPKPVPKPRKPERAEPDPEVLEPPVPEPEVPPAQPALRLRLEK